MYPAQLSARRRFSCELAIACEPSERWARERAALIAHYAPLIEAKLSAQMEEEKQEEAVPLYTVYQQTVRIHHAPEPGLGLITALQMAAVRVRSYEGGFYTYLMSHNISSKTDSCIGYTTNPLRDVCLYNERIIADRNTAAASGHWFVDIVLGPHPSLELAMECGKAWVDGTRGKVPKRKKAPFLAEAFNVNMYDCRVPLGEPFDEYLARNALPIYGEVYKEMCQ